MTSGPPAKPEAFFVRKVERRGKGEPLLKKGLPLPPRPHPPLQNFSSEKTADGSRPQGFLSAGMLSLPFPGLLQRVRQRVAALFHFSVPDEKRTATASPKGIKVRKENVTLPEKPRHARKRERSAGMTPPEALARETKVRHRGTQAAGALPAHRMQPQCCYRDGYAVSREKP